MARYRDAAEESAPTSIYHNQQDRDTSLEASYHLSGVLKAALEVSESPRSMLALIAQHVTDLAELFWREAPMTEGTGDRTKFDAWCSRHFGRQLEPSARGVLWGEVRAKQEGATTRVMGLWDSWGEQQRYERAARQLGPWRGGTDEAALDRAERIVKLATGKSVEELKPSRPLSRKAWDKRAAELTRKALALVEPAKPEETTA